MKRMQPFFRHVVHAIAFGGLPTLLVALAAGGCRTLPSTDDEAVATHPAPRLRADVMPRAELLDESPLVVGDITPERAGEHEEQFVFPEREPPPEPSYEDISPYPENLVKGIKDPDDILDVKFNFDATPLAEVVPLFATLLNFSYLTDPGVSGAVTMTVETEITAREVWHVFEHILWLSGAYASPNPGFIHVMPFDKMPRERRLLLDVEPRPNVEVAIIPIRHTSSAGILQHVQPFMTQGAQVRDLQRLNSLLIVEAPANMPKLRELIRNLDSRGEAGWPHISLRCHQVDAEIIRQELEALLPIIGLQVTNRSPAGGDVKIVAIPRLQAIVASAPLKEVLNEVERWVRLLDREDAAEQENIYFYNVRHSTASHLAEALGVFFGDSAVQAPRPSPTRSVAARATGDGGAAEAADARTRQIPRPANADSGTPGVFETRLVIFADGDQNRLTIRTTRRAYAMVEALLKRLDVPPRQVLIQGIIADVELNESLEYGFSYAAMERYKDYVVKHAFLGAGSGFPDPRNVGEGFAIRLRESDDKIAFLRAVAGDSNVRVLSAPQIMATSDQEARINVGDRVPIITGDYTDIDGVTTGTLRRNIEYTDTGVIMTVTPYVTAGNEVRLNIVQEVSDAVDTTTSDIDSPTIRNRQLSTTLVIPDGGTALLGGLIRTQEEENYTGIPLLKDIPGLGVAFRSNRKSTRRTELLVLFTVNVIDSRDAAEELINRYQRALQTIQDNINL